MDDDFLDYHIPDIPSIATEEDLRNVVEVCKRGFMFFPIDEQIEQRPERRP